MMMIELLLVLLLIVVAYSNAARLEQFNNQGCCPFLVEINQREGITIRDKISTEALAIRKHVNNKLNEYFKADVIANELDLFREDFVTTINNAKNHVKASAIAKASSVFLLFPLDTIKTRMQVSPHLKTALSPLSLSTMYRGLIASFAGNVPYHTITFGAYEVFKTKLQNQYPNVQPAKIYVLASILGDLTGSLWYCPAEVIKQQMQGGVQKHICSAVANTFRDNGIKGFYRGYLGMIARDVSFRTVQLPSYEIVKDFYLKNLAKNKTENQLKRKELEPLESMIVGAISGSLSAALTNPLDVIKTRIITNKDTLFSFGNILSTASTIVKNEGLGTLLTSGLVPRTLYFAPSAAIFYVTYEASRKYFNDLH